GGEVSGTTSPTSGGYFSYQTTAAALGQVNAIVVNNQNNSASSATASIAVANPSVTLNVTYGAGHQVTLSGTVTDQSLAGRTVSISGAATGTVTTDSSGNFSVTLTASSLGGVTATTTDAWGLTATAQTTLTNSAPVITNFGWKETSGYYIFSGKVTDEHP